MDAGDSFHAASTAVDAYSSTLTWAQARAADAIRQWSQAQGATERVKAEHEQAPANTPLHDPGEAGRQAARDTLSRARRQLDSAGNTAANAVDKARDKAPPKPGFWSRLGSGAEDIADKVGHALENAGKVLVNDAASFGNAALHHPGRFGTEIAGIGLTAASAAGLGGSGLLDATVVGSPAGVALGGVSTLGVAGGVGMIGTAVNAMAHEAAGEDHVQVFNTDSGGGEPAPGEDPPFEPPKEITGYKPHARERMFDNTRGDGGVNDAAAKDAIENPQKPPKFQADAKGGRYMYTGKDAVVVLNQNGEVVTAWPLRSAGRRFP